MKIARDKRKESQGRKTFVSAREEEKQRIAETLIEDRVSRREMKKILRHFTVEQRTMRHETISRIRGSQYDANGNLADWWDPEDFKVFTEKNRKLAAYFDSMQPWDGAHYNGEIMTGEACADMAGMKGVLRLAAKNLDFDYDRFFRAYAALWMIKENLMITEARLKDGHPLKCLRINSTLQQYDDFLNFYDIREGDGMYVAPQDRVAIW